MLILSRWSGHMDTTPGQPTTIGNIFCTPLIVQGKTWFPIVQLITWPVLVSLLKKKHPSWSRGKQWITGGLVMLITLGSEWGHNLAHAAAACYIKKPMDAIRIVWGMPLVIYRELNDLSVAPRQHIFRSLGGPIFNGIMAILTAFIRRFTRPATSARSLADAALGMNLFIGFVSLLPIPGIDGGPVLKWTLVETGHTPQQADEMVKSFNRPMGGVLAVGAALAVRRRHWLAACLMSMFSVIALATGFNLLREENINKIR